MENYKSVPDPPLRYWKPLPSGSEIGIQPPEPLPLFVQVTSLVRSNVARASPADSNAVAITAANSGKLITREYEDGQESGMDESSLL
jgi:hypothetical protein